MAHDPDSADALAAAITGADRRAAETTAAAVSATGPSDALATALGDAGALLHDALQLLGLTADLALGDPALRHALESTARVLDAVALTLEGAAERARADTSGGGDGLEGARQQLVHTLEQREADIALRRFQIDDLALRVRRARLEVSALAPTSALPAEPQMLVAGLDLPGWLTSLRSAVASSRRTVPNLITLERDDALPLSLDVHAHAIAASAETARVIEAVLSLRGVVAGRWPDAV